MEMRHKPPGAVYRIWIPSLQLFTFCLSPQSYDLLEGHRKIGSHHREYYNSPFKAPLTHSVASTFKNIQSSLVLAD